MKFLVMPYHVEFETRDEVAVVRAKLESLITPEKFWPQRSDKPFKGRLEESSFRFAVRTLVSGEEECLVRGTLRTSNTGTSIRLIFEPDWRSNVLWFMGIVFFFWILAEQFESTNMFLFTILAFGLALIGINYARSRSRQKNVDAALQTIVQHLGLDAE